MLVTDTSWAESHPVRRALARPFQAWRCVGWTDETLNFFVVASRDVQADGRQPDGWLVGGPEALVDVTSQLEPGTFAVYVLDRATDDAEVTLCRVTGIWRERELPVGVIIFWYGTQAGGLKPCFGGRPNGRGQPELINLLRLD